MNLEKLQTHNFPFMHWEMDNCVDVYNPSQEDFNNDGIGDACDGLSIAELLDSEQLIAIIDITGREIYSINKGDVVFLIFLDLLSRLLERGLVK